MLYREAGQFDESAKVYEDVIERAGKDKDLEPEEREAYTERYRYDAVGNIESMRDTAGPLGSWTRTYDYETATNRLRGTDIDNPGRAVTDDYDTHGSMSNLSAAPELSSQKEKNRTGNYKQKYASCG